MQGTLGYIRLFAGNFAPTDWEFCEGKQLKISEYSILFSLLGTTYGGDGETYFNLPDLRGGRALVGAGQGPGLSNYEPGQQGGAEHVTLTREMTAHVHDANMYLSMPYNDAGSNAQSPVSNVYGVNSTGTGVYSLHAAGNIGAGDSQLTTDKVGSSSPAPMDTRSPCIALKYIICLVGDFPPRP